MKTLLTLLVVAASFSINAQTKINGIVMPNIVKANGKYLKMNGGGIREKMFLDLYVGVLYLESKSTDAKKIIADDKSMAIKLRIVSGMVNKDNMEEAIREGFEKSTGGKQDALKSQINTLISKGFADAIVKGDVFDIIYVPGKGTSLTKNKKVLVTIPGLEFKKALFGIWLCDKPADANLKKKMLGK